MSIVRCGREEQAMFESGSDFTYGPGYLRIDRVLRPARWGSMMGFIKNHQTAAAKCPKPIDQRTRVVFIDQEAMRDQKTGMRIPGIHTEAALASHSAYVILVENFEGQSKPGVQFLLPLNEHGRRARHDDVAHLLPKQQLPRNKSGFDC